MSCFKGPCDCEDPVRPFVCRNCGRVVDPRQKFCSFQCEANYEEEKAYLMEKEEERVNDSQRATCSHCRGILEKHQCDSMVSTSNSTCECRCHNKKGELSQ